ncbi:ABC transporter substrate-binding protein [Aureibacillus halotolerans]|uniref:Carbohydrate ABC transporter substrate-binding protein (CUT1 family) n=1 Tax=Aureibacillus halotolerans TaxID=1508390 RepID=A0A4R6TUJ5_9BACI|nr:ABC transporter substrate-binding protein [Aureibacillus halotolerans]TDQ37408.1 carbohydrate ABC transporter substrate-binding protein (CUT1 family) [Aureibacillus halotolerans]
MRLARILIVFTICLGLSGCNVLAQVDYPDDVITFWHANTGVGLEATNAVVDAFNESQDEYTVKPMYSASSTGHDEKLLAAVAGGNPPDIMRFDRFMIGAWAAEGALTDLTELAERDGVLERPYYPFAIEEATYQDKLYGLPISVDSRLVFYNKDHFKAAGLDLNDLPKTLDELEEAADVLTKKTGNRFDQIGFIPWYDQGSLYTWGWSFGGQFVDPETGKVTANDEEIVAALQWLVDYGDKYGVEEMTGFVDSQGSNAMDPFLSGQLSMTVSGPWKVPQIRKFAPDLNYGVFPIPTPDGSDPITWSGGFSMVVPKGAQNVDGAWEFAKYFSSQEGQEIFSGIIGDFAVMDSANEALGYTDDPILGEFIDILPDAKYRPVLPEGALLWNELVSAIDHATRHNGTPQEILDDVTNYVNQKMERKNLLQGEGES